MLIMALNSATPGCSVAIWQDGTVLACRNEDMMRGQTEALIPMAQTVLDYAGFSFADVDLFAVTVGPGSFTGVRAGLATARGLGLAAARPVAGVTTTEAVAWAVGARGYEKRPVLVALDTRRADVYIQPFLLTATLPVPLAPVRVLMPAAIADFLADLSPSVVVAGDGASRLGSYLPTSTLVVDGLRPQACAVAAIAAGRERSGRIAAEPLYLCPPAMTIPSAISIPRTILPIAVGGEKDTCRSSRAP